MKKYFVARMFNMLNPSIVEIFETKADAESYAALMSRTKKKSYVVLEVVSEWLNSEEE